jgi:hypothetical protein
VLHSGLLYPSSPIGSSVLNRRKHGFRKRQRGQVTCRPYHQARCRLYRYEAITSHLNSYNLTLPRRRSETASIDAANKDGASEPLGGSNLQEPEYDVEVKLSDLQADPNNPLFSVKSFEDLGLYVSQVKLLYI